MITETVTKEFLALFDEAAERYRVMWTRDTFIRDATTIWNDANTGMRWNLRSSVFYEAIKYAKDNKLSSDDWLIAIKAVYPRDERDKRPVNLKMWQAVRLLDALNAVGVTTEEADWLRSAIEQGASVPLAEWKAEEKVNANDQ